MHVDGPFPRWIEQHSKPATAKLPVRPHIGAFWQPSGPEVTPGKVDRAGSYDGCRRYPGGTPGVPPQRLPPLKKAGEDTDLTHHCASWNFPAGATGESDLRRNGYRVVVGYSRSGSPLSARTQFREIGIFTILLVPVAELIDRGMLMPMGAFAGMVTFTWYSPTRVGVRPAKVEVAVTWVPSELKDTVTGTTVRVGFNDAAWPLCATGVV